MKVVGITEVHEKTDTAILIQTVFNELMKQDIETELIQLSENTLKAAKPVGLVIKT